MVLTNDDWNAIYEAANNPVDADMISEGMVAAIEDVFGQVPASTIADATSAALQGINDAWIPVIYGASDAVAEATKATAEAAKNTASATKGVQEISGEISKQVGTFSALMVAIATAAGSENQDFNTWVPVINSLAGLIEGLPAASAPTYVDWAGTGANITEEMRQQKAANDAANFAKGTYTVVKDLAPILLKHTASIGGALTTIIAQDGAVWATALGAIMTGNPMGAIIAIPTLLKNIFTMLPLIINAIVEIVPALIGAIIKFLSKFMPNSTFAYDTLDAANKAVTDNEAALKAGATAPNFVIPKNTTIQGAAPANETVTINIHGGLIMPNVTKPEDASGLINNIKILAEK